VAGSSAARSRLWINARQATWQHLVRHRFKTGPAQRRWKNRLFVPTVSSATCDCAVDVYLRDFASFVAGKRHPPTQHQHQPPTQVCTAGLLSLLVPHYHGPDMSAHVVCLFCFCLSCVCFFPRLSFSLVFTIPPLVMRWPFTCRIDRQAMTFTASPSIICSPHQHKYPLQPLTTSTSIVDTTIPSDHGGKHSPAAAGVPS
jgi:hypothetical protein